VMDPQATVDVPGTGIAGTGFFAEEVPAVDIQAGTPAQVVLSIFKAATNEFSPEEMQLIARHDQKTGRSPIRPAVSSDPEVQGAQIPEDALVIEMIDPETKETVLQPAPPFVQDYWAQLLEQAGPGQHPGARLVVEHMQGGSPMPITDEEVEGFKQTLRTGDQTPTPEDPADTGLEQQRVTPGGRVRTEPATIPQTITPEDREAIEALEEAKRLGFGQPGDDELIARLKGEPTAQQVDPLNLALRQGISGIQRSPVFPTIREGASLLGEGAVATGRAAVDVLSGDLARRRQRKLEEARDRARAINPSRVAGRRR